MTFLECDSGIWGQVLADMMLTFLRKHDLGPYQVMHARLQWCRQYALQEGAAARITCQFPVAVYLHIVPPTVWIWVWWAHLRKLVCAIRHELWIKLPFSSLHNTNNSTSLRKQLKSQSQSLLFIRWKISAKRVDWEDRCSAAILILTASFLSCCMLGEHIRWRNYTVLLLFISLPA